MLESLKAFVDTGALSGDVIFNATVVCLCLQYAWHTYLSYRQYRVITRTRLHPRTTSVDAQKKFNRTKAYALHRERFGFVRRLYALLECLVVLYCNVIPLLWSVAGQLVAYIGYEHEINQTTAFLVITTLLSTFSSLPWKLYATFVMEQKFGFNKQTLRFFAVDQLKNVALSLALTIPVMCVLVTLVQHGGDYFYVYAWAFVSVVTLVMTTVYPEYIAPLFDKYTPLKDGKLRVMIEQLARRLQFPLKQLYVVAGSKRSAHSNAYLSGFGKNKRIVLYDTLLEDYPEPNSVPLKAKLSNLFKPKNGMTENNKDNLKNGRVTTTPVALNEKRSRGCNNDEVVAILGHELGHWKLNHITKMLVVNELSMLLTFVGFAYCFTQRELYHAFGFSDTYPVMIGLFLVFEYVFAPYNELLSIFTTVFTRRHEIAADKFAANLGYSERLQSALAKLDEDNLTFPANDWLYAWLNFDHPPTAERITRLKQLKLQ